MSITAGIIGNAYIGTDRIGIIREGFILNLCNISRLLVAAFGQQVPTLLSPAAKVLIDGVDVSQYVTRLEVHHVADSSANMARLEVQYDDLSVQSGTSEILIRIDYSLSNGLNFSAERFHGKVVTIESPIGDGGQKVHNLICYDLGYRLSMEEPSLGDYTYMHYSAKKLIDMELAAKGLSPSIGTFQDYSVIVTPSKFKNGRELIYAIANGKRKTLMFMAPSGQMILTDFENPISSTWEFPLQGQISQQTYQSTFERYNRVPFTGYWSGVYNDYADQAIYGVLSHSGVTRYISGLTNAEELSFAKTICDDSKFQRIDFVAPLNPAIFPGCRIKVTKSNGDECHVRIDSIVDMADWQSGFWSNFSGRIVTV